MAASASTAFAVSTTLDLSSKAAFSCNSSSNNVVQKVSVVRSAARVGGVRASSTNSDESRPARREMLAGIVAAGAALGFSPQQAFAIGNPVATAKGKADEALQGAKELGASNPLDSVTGSNPVGEVQGALDEAGSSIKRRIDGLFGKDKPYPKKDTKVTGKGAIADAQNRVESFFDNSKNPLATNIEKVNKEYGAKVDDITGETGPSAVAKKEIVGKDSSRVDEATERVNSGAEKLKGKALQAVGDAKEAAQDVKGAAQEAAPDASLPSAPSLPSVPSLPSIPTPQGSNLFKGLSNKLDEAKSNLPGQ